MNTNHCMNQENSAVPGPLQGVGHYLATDATPEGTSSCPHLDLNLDFGITILPDSAKPPRQDITEQSPPRLMQLEATTTATVFSNPSPQLQGVLMVLRTERIRTGSMPARVDLAFVGDSIEPLRSSLKEFGVNLVPIVVRQLPPTSGNTEAQYQLVSGHRRLQVARDEGLEVKALVLGQTDRSPDLQQLISNVLREPLSPYESGRQIRHVLDNDWTKSVSALAKTIGKSKTQVSRELSLAGLPPLVLKAFIDLRELRVRDGPALTRALDRDQAAVLSEAQVIAALSDKPDARETVKRLLAATGIPGTVAQCNTPQDLVAGGQIAGTWCIGTAGELDIHITGPMSTIEHKRLVSKLQQILKKYVDP